MLAFSEIIIQLERHIRLGGDGGTLSFSSKPEDNRVSWPEYRSCIKTLLRAAIAGTVVGALPGLGAPVASFFAYDQEKKRSKNPEEFGKGKIQGIAASESANSAVGGSLIPLFTLGIPGNVAAALLIGAFVVHDMIPGPLMFEKNAQFIYSIYGSLIVANIFLLGTGIAGLNTFCKVVQTAAAILFPIVIFTCIIGSCLAGFSAFEVTLMLFFAFVAYFMKKFDFNHICFIIGFILAPIWETSLQQVIIASQNDPYMFFTRPMAMILWPLPLTLSSRQPEESSRRDDDIGHHCIG